MSADAIERMDINLADPAFVRDPWSTLSNVRTAGSAVYNETLKGWMIAGYRDVARVMGNARNFTTEKLGETYAGLFGGNTMQFDDTPRHDAIKMVWARRMQRDALADLKGMIAEIVDIRLIPFIERIRAGEAVEARQDLTRGIPTMVIARMMGIPEERFEEFGAWSDAMGGTLGGILDPSENGRRAEAEGRAATAKMNAYAAEVIADRRREPGSDLVSNLVVSDVARDQMTEQEIVASITQLVFAGNETTANLMALTLHALSLNPEQRKRLAEDRSLIPQAIEEVNRWSTPVAVKSRTARGGNAQVGSIAIPDGDTIFCLPIAANRDPARWDKPDDFDIARPYQPHIGFGFGRHVCLGLNLGRLEAIVWLNRLLDELPEWEMVGDPDYETNFFVRGPKSIIIAAA
ncbi:MAG: cytochrome P450 [Sphingomonadales bacterium]